MTTDIEPAVLRVQEIVGALEGIRAAPDYPPEQSSVFPFAVSFIADVETTRHTVGNVTELYTIRTAIHISRKDLPRDIQTMAPYPKLFTRAIVTDPTLKRDGEATVDTVLGCRGSLLESQWGGVETLAYVFDTRVKVKWNETT